MDPRSLAKALATFAFIAAILCLLAVFLTATATPAHSDTGSPGIVTYAEWRDLNNRATMTQIEHVWQVVGAGTVTHTQDHGKYVVKQYPSVRANYVQVFYTLNADNQYVASYSSYFNFDRSDR